MRRLDATAYLAARGFEAQLEAELKDVTARHGRLFVATGPRQPAYWAQNVWLTPHEVEVKSIKDASRQLMNVQRNWWPYAHDFHRRMELIGSGLPHVSAKPLPFPCAAPAPLGSFTLVSQDLMLCSAACTSPFPNGDAAFQEYTVGPPSRAYLKVWEALTLLGAAPKPGERCLDLGASPGGWTWALARLGAEVVAFDRSPLDPAVRAMPGVSEMVGDAFQATPEKVGKVDWLFSDVICYPERLLEHVKLWMAAGAAKNFVCTLKFQGDEHYGVIKDFAAIPGARVMHLFNNKHELTFALLGK